MHSIRLRGPWQYQVLTRYEKGADGQRGDVPSDLSGSGTVVMPASWPALLGGGFRGRIRLVREFHCPTNLDADERVELVIERSAAVACVRFNESTLTVRRSDHQAVRFSIRDLLQPRNRLEIELVSDGTGPGISDLDRQDPESSPEELIGEVRLEIGCS